MVSYSVGLRPVNPCLLTVRGWHIYVDGSIIDVGRSPCSQKEFYSNQDIWLNNRVLRFIDHASSSSLHYLSVHPQWSINGTHIRWWKDFPTAVFHHIKYALVFVALYFAVFPSSLDAFQTPGTWPHNSPESWLKLLINNINDYGQWSYNQHCRVYVMSTCILYM